MSAELIPFQYELFETHEERIARMRLEEVESIARSAKATVDRVRKGTYANIGDLKKRTQDLEERLSLLERSICNER